ncbi:hypothetical protein ACCAA_440031 [Candidatus Accumulibacter aalborgensis]|uniref:Uncharacterized protein n=1 Tax=Candidatus Accumulibacter aalborgensis TaxID=1860102 RepID=A0A1A8XS44_9PROT|nr:hypothetical protein ACCAA_440031 [Candidatus Accumulibacter aalborgensis]
MWVGFAPLVAPSPARVDVTRSKTSSRLRGTRSCLVFGARVHHMPVGVFAAADQTLRLQAGECGFDDWNVDAPVDRQPPLADAVHGVSSLGMAVQIAQDGVYHLAEAWLRVHWLLSPEATGIQKQSSCYAGFGQGSALRCGDSVPPEFLRLDAMLLEQFAQCAPFLAGQTCGARYVAGAFRHQAQQLATFESHQDLLLGFVEIERRGVGHAAIGLASAITVRGQGTDQDGWSVAKQELPLDAVLQLANVAWPRIGEQPVHGIGMQFLDRQVILTRRFGDEVTGEQDGVVGARAQRRNVKIHRSEAIVEVGPEFILADTLHEIAVAGGDDANVSLFGVAAAQPAILAVLEEAQQADLRLWRQCVDFVKKQCAALGLGNQADLALTRVGISPSGVAEEFVLDQMIGQRTAVDRDERTVSTSPLVVDGARRHLLAAAGLTADQNGGVVARDPGKNRQHPPEGGGLAYETICCRQIAHRPSSMLRSAKTPDSLHLELGT